jgi:hypothetical protein
MKDGPKIRAHHLLGNLEFCRFHRSAQRHSRTTNQSIQAAKGIRYHPDSPGTCFRVRCISNARYDPRSWNIQAGNRVHQAIFIPRHQADRTASIKKPASHFPA